MWPYLLHAMCYKTNQMQIMREETKWYHERGQGKVVEAEKGLLGDGIAFGVKRIGDPDTKKKVSKYRLPRRLQWLIVFIIQFIVLWISLHFVFFLPLLSVNGCCEATYLALTSGTLGALCATFLGEAGGSGTLSLSIISSTSIIKAFPKIKSWMSRYLISVGLL